MNIVDPALHLLDENPPKPTSLADLLIYYMDHPVEWITDTLQKQPYSWQADAIEALNREKYISVRSGHGVGKSWFVVTSALWFLCTRPMSRVICTAPTKEQLYDVIWAQFAETVRLSKSLDGFLRVTKDQVQVRTHPQEWFAAARTSEVKRIGKDGFSVAEGLQGRHGESLLFIIDEASGVDEAIMSTVNGALTTDDCYVILTGNPTRPSGFFYASHHSQRHLWKTFHVNCEEVPSIPKKWIQRMLDTYGSREHPLYRIRVRGEFPQAAHNSVFPLDLVERTQKLLVEPTKFDTVEIGVDVARYGDDFTVIAVKHGSKIIRLDRYPHFSTMETAGKVMRYSQEFQPQAIRIDTVGVGGGVYDRLRELKVPNLISINAGSSPLSDKAKKEYINLRAEMHFHMRTLMEQNLLALPDKDEELLAQMSIVTFETTSSGKVKVASKEDMRKLYSGEGSKSPDKLDAIMLACIPVFEKRNRRSFFGDLNIMAR